MKEYHYIDVTGNQCGPYPIYELKNFPIVKNTLVWTSGMKDWNEASSVEDLNFLFEGDLDTEVPPTPIRVQPDQQTKQNTAYASNQRSVSDEVMPMPKNWLVESILITVLCCLPFGIVGILSASKVESRYREGDYEGALKSSKEAKKWTIVGFVSSVIFYIFYILFVVILSAFGALY